MSWRRNSLMHKSLQVELLGRFGALLGRPRLHQCCRVRIFNRYLM